MDSMLTGVLVVAGVAALALALRATSKGDETVGGPGPVAADDPGPRDEPEAVGGDDEPEDTFAVVSSDGWTFVPFGDGVGLWAPADEDTDAVEPRKPAAAVQPGFAASRPAVVLSAGDLVAARVVPGVVGEAPWIVEALGRDREFSSWSFETEEAARAARELLVRLVVRAATDADEDAAVSDADFDEARHVAEETLRELAMPDPPEETKG